MTYKVFHTCPMCGDVFVSAEHFSQHQTMVHSSSSSDVNTGSTSSTTSTTVTSITVDMEPTTTTTQTINLVSCANDTTIVTSAAVTATSITMSPIVTMTSASILLSQSDVTMATTTAIYETTSSVATGTISIATSTFITTSPTMTTASTQDFFPLAVTTTLWPSITCIPQHVVHSNPSSLPPTLHDNHSNLISSSHHSPPLITSSFVNCPTTHATADDADLIPLQDTSICLSESIVNPIEGLDVSVSGENSDKDDELLKETIIGAPSKEISIIGEPPRENSITEKVSRENSVTEEPTQEDNVTGDLLGDCSIVGKPSSLIINQSGTDPKPLRRPKPFDFEKLQDQHRVYYIFLWSILFAV